jgi:inhibitor of Bruton tyrosine kinase
MVSAISRATICLLANHTVYVFTNYGYNNVKFPIQDSFTSYHLNSPAPTTRLEIEPGHISMISSGGDTLAAISSRGDLFTINVNQKPDSSPTATSTTNLTKIRNALSQPQRIWSLRKGHWDGVKSVGISENGSMIICTQAGAVWRRIRRVKIKDAYASGIGEIKSKDYKFQRVPGLTNVVAVRSNVFGGYAAIRKDCDVMTQIQVNEPSLWNDLGPLFSLRELEVTEPGGEGPTPGLLSEHFSPLKRAVLFSADLERDVLRHIRGISDNDYDVEVSTTLSDASIPVHGFMVTARSPVLRNSFHEFRRHDTYSNPELHMSSTGGKLKLQFQGLDFLTVFNFALYLYSDDVVDVWHFTRYAPKSAFRFRQIRAELMKLAAKLGMSSLESAVRLMSEPERRLNIDIKTAVAYPYFFEDGDVVIQLDGGDVTVHRALMCQRCPFFDGLFKGRAAGRWLAGRHKSSEPIKIDMKHIDLATFGIVLQYLYADTGTEVSP